MAENCIKLIVNMKLKTQFELSRNLQKEKCDLKNDAHNAISTIKAENKIQ